MRQLVTSGEYELTECDVKCVLTPPFTSLVEDTRKDLLRFGGAGWGNLVQTSILRQSVPKWQFLNINGHKMMLSRIVRFRYKIGQSSIVPLVLANKKEMNAGT